jgi:hypothetical protein
VYCCQYIYLLIFQLLTLNIPNSNDAVSALWTPRRASGSCRQEARSSPENAQRGCVAALDLDTPGGVQKVTSGLLKQYASLHGPRRAHTLIHPKNTAPVPRPTLEKPNLLSSRPSRRSINAMLFPSKSPWPEAGETGNTLPPLLIRRVILGEQRSQSQKYSSLLGLEVRTLGSASSRNSFPLRR